MDDTITVCTAAESTKQGPAKIVRPGDLYYFFVSLQLLDLSQMNAPNEMTVAQRDSNLSSFFALRSSPNSTPYYSSKKRI